MASAILVTDSETLAQQVLKEIDAFLEELPRTDIIRASLDSYGYILIARDLEEAVEKLF